LGLVDKLQRRIARIDREVGLDGSVLGEVVSGRSLDKLHQLKEADTEIEKVAILEELELTSDLVSLDEIRLPLLEFFKEQGGEAAKDIPLGIHSAREDSPLGLNGIFLAFKVKDQSTWHYYPRGDNGDISTSPINLTVSIGKLFKYIQCRHQDYPRPDMLKPVNLMPLFLPFWMMQSEMY